MSSTYTSILRLELMGTGDQFDAWGTTLDNQLTLIENAIAKNQPITTTGGTTTLSTSNGADDQSRSLCLDFTGVLVSNATIVVPSKSKMYIVRNSTSGSFTLTVKTAAGTGVVLPQTGTAVLVYCDGVNVVSIGAVGSIDANTLGGIAASGFFQLASTNVVQKGYSETVRALTVTAGAFTLDCAQAVNNSVTLNAANCTMSVTNAVNGAWFELYIKQDVTGSRLITYPGNFRFVNGATPDLSSAANAVDMVRGRYDSVGGVWNCTTGTNFATGGAVSSANVILATNEIDVDIFARAGSPAGAVTVTVTVNPGVIIQASSTSVGAINLMGFAAGSTVLINNLGYIIGKGGDGGFGGSEENQGASGIGEFMSAHAGYDGGPAIKCMTSNCTVTVSNGSGRVWGGGGGGGGGGFLGVGANEAAVGGGGGGGAGGSKGGFGGQTQNGGTAYRAGDGGDGVPGRLGSAGTGGTGVAAGGAGAGNGGNGGTYGAVGVAGTNTLPGAAGAAGKAVDKNGSLGGITVSGGSILGAIA